MRHALSLLAMVVLLGTAHADFPPVSKLPSRPELPDPLVMLDGTRVTSREQWLNQRRPELKGLFQHYMYGYLPAPMKIESKVEREDRQAFGGKATVKEVTIAFGPPETPKVRLLLVVPNERKGPAPAFVALSFTGIDTLIPKDPTTAVAAAWPFDLA